MKMIKLITGIIAALILITSIAIVMTPSEKTVIGAVLPLTGPIAPGIGPECEQGIRQALTGTGMELEVEDSKSSNTEGLSGLNKIITTKQPKAIITIGSGLILALEPIAKQNNIPLIATITSSPQVTKNNYTYRYYPMAEQELQAMDKLITGKAGILYTNDDFGNAIYNKLKEKMNIYGQTFNMNEAEYRTQLAKIKEQNPDTLIIVGYISHTVNAVKQARELGINAKIATTSLGSIPSVREQLQNISDYYTPAPITYKTEKTDHYTQSCYDAAKLAVQSITTGMPEQFTGKMGTVNKNGHEYNFELYPALISKGEIKYIS